MKRKQIFNFIIFAVLFAAPILFAACGGSKRENNSNANPESQTVDVTTAQAVVQQIPTYFEATGNLASDAQTDVAPAVGGKIVEVNFDIGSYVEKGAVLVRLDDRDARIRLEQAQAQVEDEAQQANVDQAIAALRQTQVRLGVKTARLFKSKISRRSNRSRRSSSLRKRNWRAPSGFTQTGDVSRRSLDQRRSQRDALLGQLDEARSNAAVASRRSTPRAQRLKRREPLLRPRERRLRRRRKRLATRWFMRRSAVTSRKERRISANLFRRTCRTQKSRRLSEPRFCE